MKIVGVIVAGGRAERFGAEKALARLGGRSLLERVAAHISPGAAEIAVNAPAQSKTAAFARTFGYDIATDAAGDVQGPLAGIKAALLWGEMCGAELVRIAPCDTPFLPADLYPRLEDAIGEARAIVAESPDGLQPLCGVWRPSARSGLAVATAGGLHPSMREALDILEALCLRFPDAVAFANINTPDDLARAEARL